MTGPLEQPRVEGTRASSPRAESRLGRLEGGFSRFVGATTALLLLGIVVVISYQVAARYLPGMRVPRWTEEVSLILMVWLAMLGSGLGVRAGEHLAMDIALRQLGARAQRLVSRLIYLLVAGFGVYLVVYGYELASRTMGQTFAASKLPIGWMYLGIPLGGVLVALYALRALFVPPPALGEAAAIPKRNRLLQGTLLAMALLLILGGVAVFGPSLWGPIGVLLGSFALLLVAGVPIAVGVGIASLITALTLELPPLIIAQRMANGVSSTPLLAIPFFILAGQIMAEGGIAKRLVDFARVLVGPIPGGLAMVNVVSSMLFGGASGSAVADVSANGTILIPMMKRQGYGGDFSTAITVASSVQGIIIPPSHNAVIYSLAAG